MKDKLTKRQQQVAALAATGLSNKQIARKLGLAVGTVRIHLSAIYERMGWRNRTVLAITLSATGPMSS
jgi:two-component system, NarL family, nitrate/nitrite response regulator NarL